MSRDIYRYDKCNLFNYYLLCIRCRAERNLSKVQFFEKQWQMILGREKLHKELDIVKLCKTQRDVRIIKQTDIEQHDEMLSKF